MKKTLLALCIGLPLFNLHPQTYQKMIEEGNKWNYLAFHGGTIGNGEYVTYSLSLTGDTIIDNKTYKKVKCELTTSDGMHSQHYAGALREEATDQNVFLMLPNGKEEKVFAFAYVTGDTIALDTINIYENGHIEYSVRTVKSVDTANIGGVKRKRLEICDSTYHANHPYLTWEPFETYRDYWYEGIGSMEHIFIPMAYDIAYDKGLLCFWQKENLIYKNSKGYDCLYTERIKTGIDGQCQPTMIELFPNPTTGSVRIKSDSPIENITISDLNGVVLLNTKQTTWVDVSKMPTGMYLIKIETSAGNVVKKIIKKNI